MTRQRISLVCLFVAAAALIGFAGLNVGKLQAQVKPTAEKTAVAIVNVREVIAKCKKNETFQAEMKQRREALQKEAKEKETMINALKLQIRDEAPDKATRDKKMRELIKLDTEFRAWQQIQNQFLVQEQQTKLVEMYGEIDEVIAEVAKSQGFDLVLLDQPTPDIENLNGEQLLNLITNRRVLYKNAKVDISNSVLAEMDLKFKAQGN